MDEVGENGTEWCRRVAPRQLAGAPAPGFLSSLPLCLCLASFPNMYVSIQQSRAEPRPQGARLPVGWWAGPLAAKNSTRAPWATSLGPLPSTRTGPSGPLGILGGHSLPSESLKPEVQGRSGSGNCQELMGTGRGRDLCSTPCRGLCLPGTHWHPGAMQVPAAVLASYSPFAPF